MAAANQLWENIIRTFCRLPSFAWQNMGSASKQKDIGFRELYFNLKLKQVRSVKEYRRSNVRITDEASLRDFEEKEKIRKAYAEKNREMILKLKPFLDSWAKENPGYARRLFPVKDAQKSDQDKNAPAGGENPGSVCVRRIIRSVPGSGKTTYLKRLALACVDDDEQVLLDAGLKRGLWPVFIPCSSLNRDPEGKTLEFAGDFAAMSYFMLSNSIVDFADRLSAEEYFELLDEHAGNGTLLFLIDAYDEIWDEKAQRDFTEKICGYFEENPGVGFILTSRMEPFIAEDDAARSIQDIKGTSFFTIEELNDEDMENFCRKWYSSMFTDAGTAKAYADEVIRQLRSQRLLYVRSMIRLPLHLTIFLIIGYINGRLPDTKAGLYREYINICMTWKDSGEDDPEDMWMILSYVAYWMSTKRVNRILGHHMALQMREAYRNLEGYFNNYIEDSERLDYSEKLISKFINRGILHISATADGKNYLSFPHLQLQEYLAAHALACGYYMGEETFAEIVAKNCNYRNWKEILEMAISQSDGQTAAAMINVLLSKEWESSANAYTDHLLFSLVTCSVKCPKALKYRVYEHFKNALHDNQIMTISEIISNDSSDFAEFIMRGFTDGLNEGQVQYEFAAAAIKCFQDMNAGQNPLGQAFSMLSGESRADRLLALNVITIICWCKYIKSTSTLKDVEFYTAGEEVYRSLYDCIDDDNYPVSSSAVSAVRDMVLCGYPGFEKFFCMEFMKRILKESEPYKRGGILGVAPVNFFTMGLGEKMAADDVKKKVYGEYSEAKRGDGDYSELVFLFNECAILGCFANEDALMDELLDIDFIYRQNARDLDDGPQIRRNQLLTMLTSLPNAIQAGVDYYQKGMLKEAECSFIYGANEGAREAKLNLAYLLRRGEIDRVFINKNELTVEELFKDSLDAGDDFAFINQALVISGINGASSFEEVKYDAALDYLRSKIRVEFTDLQLIRIYKWWLDMAKKKDREGFLVLLWLMDMGFADTTDLGDRQELLTWLKETF